jgi:dephospho-CoA kinase
LNIAVTGGYGSGKSSVSRLLASGLTGQLVNTDELCRTLLEPGQDGFLFVQKTFGDRFLTTDGVLDRGLLRQAAFGDTEVKDKLEDILHPLVRGEVKKNVEVCQNAGVHLVVEVPLLFEVSWQDDFDISVLVRIDNKTSAERAVQRDNITVADAERIIALQMPMSQKEVLADYIIDNGGTFASTAQQVAWLATLLRHQSLRKD